MFKKKAEPISGMDLMILMADSAAMAGEPWAADALDLSQDMAINDAWMRFEGVPARQQTVLRVIMACGGHAKKSNDPHVMFEVAVCGAMLMARMNENGSAGN